MYQLSIATIMLCNIQPNKKMSKSGFQSLQVISILLGPLTWMGSSGRSSVGWPCSLTYLGLWLLAQLFPHGLHHTAGQYGLVHMAIAGSQRDRVGEYTPFQVKVQSSSVILQKCMIQKGIKIRDVFTINLSHHENSN